MIPGASLTRTIRVSDSHEELLRNVRKSGAGTVSVGNGILNIYSPGIDQWCYVYLPVYAPRGTVIEVKFEARQYDSTSNGKLLFDNKPDRTDFPSGFIDHITPDSTNWKPYTVTHSGDHKKPYSFISFGFNTPSVGRIHFRNIMINIYNVTAPNPDVRLGMIRHEDDSQDWRIDDAFGRFTNIGVHKLEVKKGQDYILVHFAPLQSSAMPIVQAQIYHNGGRTNYHTSVFSDIDYARIYIVRSSTGEIIMPSDVTGTFMVGLTAMAF